MHVLETPQLKKLSLAYFSVTLLVASLFFSVQPVNSAVYSFFWLKPGTGAFYSLGSAVLGFDDHGYANPVRGNYSWICLEVNDTHAILDVEVNIEVFQRPGWQNPGYIRYFGIEFLEMAAAGDLSFIKRVPMDQVVGRIELINRTTPGDEYYAVKIPSPIIISQKFSVVVDLDTMELIDENGEAWGKWALWIDPLKYPLEGNTEELFIMDWLNTTVSLNVRYKAPPKSMVIDTMFGEIVRYFVAWCDPIENDFLLELGVQGMTDICMSNYYEPRTGIFLWAGLFDYLDDVLTQKFGIIKTSTHAWPDFFYLSDVTFVPDLNGDYKVDIRDVTAVATAYASTSDDPRWNPEADFDHNDIINIRDITIVAMEFGTTFIE